MLCVLTCPISRNMFAAFATLSMSFTTWMQAHKTLLFNCVCFLLNHFIVDCEFLILHLFTVCNLRELKFTTLVLNYCIALYTCIYLLIYICTCSSMELYKNINHLCMPPF